EVGCVADPGCEEPSRRDSSQPSPAGCLGPIARRQRAPSTRISGGPLPRPLPRRVCLLIGSPSSVQRSAAQTVVPSPGAPPPAVELATICGATTRPPVVTRAETLAGEVTPTARSLMRSSSPEDDRFATATSSRFVNGGCGGRLGGRQSRRRPEQLVGQLLAFGHVAANPCRQLGCAGRQPSSRFAFAFDAPRTSVIITTPA